MKTVNQNKGQTLIEFGLVFGLVIVGLLVALAAFRPELLKTYFRTSITPGGHIDSNKQLVVPAMGD